MCYRSMNLSGKLLEKDFSKNCERGAFQGIALHIGGVKKMDDTKKKKKDF